MDEYLTIKEVSETLKLSQRTITRYINNGLLHAVRINRKTVRIPKKKLKIFLDHYSGKNLSIEGRSKAKAITLRIASD